MNTKKLLFFILTLVCCQILSAQFYKNIEVNANYNVLFESDLQLTYNSIIGIGAQYKILEKNKFKLFTGLESYFDVGTQNANYLAINIPLNLRYRLFNLFQRPLQADASIGLSYSNEQLSVRLIEGDRTLEESNLGYIAHAGIMYNAYHHFHIKLNFRTFNGDGSALSAGIAYQF